MKLLKPGAPGVKTASRLRRLGSLAVRDAFETETLIWAWLVNGIAASNAVPGRARVIIYRFLGMSLSSSSSVRPGVFFRSRQVRIGAESAVNVRCVFDNRSGVFIGERVGIGIEVLFLNTDHDTGDSSRRAGVGSSAPIFIGDGAFLGSRVTVMPGVSIGEGCVVAAGSVVLSDLAPHGLYAGVPARRVRTLSAG